jgi:transcriptional regulator with XRE-family HTH domain
MATMTMLKTWMTAAAPDEQEQLAQAAGTSRRHLYQVSNGERAFSPTKAALVERATHALHRQTSGRLPLLYRTDLAEACAGCEFAKKCLGPAAVRSEFPLTDNEGVDHD